MVSSTHLLDIAGDEQYIEKIQLKYEKEAKEKGIYIVSSCGFDSVIVDMGVRFLKKNFDGELNAVESYLFFKVGPQVCHTFLEFLKTSYQCPE